MLLLKRLYGICSRAFVTALLLILLLSTFPNGARAGTCATEGKLPGTAHASTMLFGLNGVANAGMLSPCVFRGNQPTAEGYQTLSRLGIRTVINLRSRHGEKAAVEAAGMRSIEFPLAMAERISTADIRKIVRAMADPANQPVFVHCALGRDRTGVVVAAYRMEVEGWSRIDAEQEMQAFGFNDAWIHLTRLVRRYADELEKR